MKKSLQKPRSKPFFCHDENLEFFSLRKDCSKDARFISAVRVMKKQGAKDPEVIDTCDKKDYHILTHNTSDFQNPKKDIRIGIICVGLKAEYYWIPKFKRILKSLPQHNDYFHKNILIAEIITVKDRRTNEIRII